MNNIKEELTKTNEEIEALKKELEKVRSEKKRKEALKEEALNLIKKINESFK